MAYRLPLTSRSWRSTPLRFKGRYGRLSGRFRRTAGGLATAPPIRISDLPLPRMRPVAPGNTRTAPPDEGRVTHYYVDPKPPQRSRSCIKIGRGSFRGMLQKETLSPDIENDGPRVVYSLNVQAQRRHSEVCRPCGLMSAFMADTWPRAISRLSHLPDGVQRIAPTRFHLHRNPV